MSRIQHHWKPFLRNDRRFSLSFLFLPWILMIHSSTELRLLGQSRMNFIVCIADDINWDDYGCYGSPCARTPRIDAIAARGMRFTSAYLTASSCSPSRSSMITGRYPHNLGPAAELHQPISANIPWLPALLREHGYFTSLVGKNHMSREGTKVGGETWDRIDNGVTPSNHGAESKWAQAIADRPKDKPFFFWFAGIDAHREWEADNEWDEAKYGPKHRPEDMVVPPFLVDELTTRRDLASYHNEITRFDYFVGQVVDMLSEQEELDNTLLLVLADNGRPFPRSKTRLHDSGMKTALVAHWPKGISPGGVSTDSLVSVIDIAPTFLELAGIDSAPSMQGISFSKILRNPKATTRRYAFSEHNWHDYEAHGRAVRGDGWLYIRNARPDLPWQGPADSVRSPAHVALRARRDSRQLTPAQADVFLVPRPREELYLTTNDPNQLNNLVSDSRYTSVKDRMAAILDQWIEETGDTIPATLASDKFDRETGVALRGKKDSGNRAEYPGQSRNAAFQNSPGPR